MSIPGSGSPLLLATTAAAAAAEYVIPKSLRFNPTDTAFLSRTPSTAGNRRTWTVSLWLKRSKLGTNNQHVLETASSPEYSGLWFAQDDSLEFRGFNGSSYTYRLHTTQKFRDPSAWYHIVISFDSTASTSSDRLAMYVNGVKVTDFANTVYPSQNHDSNWNNTAAHYIGTFIGSSNYYGGLIADLQSIDGQALQATDFGETRSDDGVWVPKEFTGSYGTNGFHLNFSDSSTNEALGFDSAPTIPALDPKKGMDVVTYTGTGSLQNIGGLQFEPGLIWQKPRSNANPHQLYDSVRGDNARLKPSSTDGEYTYSAGVGLTFNPDGFAVGTDNGLNQSGQTFVAWVWRAGGPAVSNTDGAVTSQVSVNTDYGFSIVTVTPTATGQTVGHGLGATPSWIIYKNRDTAGNWRVHHTSLGTSKTLFLNTNSAESTNSDRVTAVTSSTFTLGDIVANDDHVAYCWSEVSGFSKFGSYTGNGSSTGPVVTTGFKVRWLLLKRTDSGTSDNWAIIDNERDFTNPISKRLFANIDNIESDSSGNDVDFLDDGFQPKNTNDHTNANGGNFVYMAFADRPGNNWGVNNIVTHEGLTTSKSQFDVVTYTGTGSTRSITGLNFQPDFVWIKPRNASDHHILYDSVRGVRKQLYTTLSNAEETETQGLSAFTSDGFTVNGAHTVRGQTNDSGNTYVAWCWKAGGTAVSNTDGSITSSVSANAQHGFSIVSYTGNGTGGATIGHGLNAAPELLITKDRDNANSWHVQHSAIGNTKAIFLNSTSAAVSNSAYWNNTSPTSSVFSVGTADGMNGSGSDYIAYCFANVPGYQRINSYIGNGTSGHKVVLGFKPRFLMIKSVTNATDWWLWDTERGNSKFLLASSSNGGYANDGVIGNYPINATNDGFTIDNTADLNQNGVEYIYLAIGDDEVGSDEDCLVDVPNAVTADADATDTTGGYQRGNYATLNPVTGFAAPVVLSNGNLDVSTSGLSESWRGAVATIAQKSGKWYAEFTITAKHASNHINVGINPLNKQATALQSDSTSGHYYNSEGKFWNANSYGGSYDSYGAGDVIGVAVDMDTNDDVKFYKNGVLQGTVSLNSNITTYGFQFAVAPYAQGGSTVTSLSCNFGQMRFKYPMPSGYAALNTTALPTATIPDGSTYFNAKTYSGIGGTQSVTGLGFSPDFLWIKRRDASQDHILVDVIRGSNKELRSNSNAGEATYNRNVTSFDSDGFSLWDGQPNTNGASFIAWAWDGGSSTVSNTDGSITSSVRASQTSGFSIVKYTGTSASTNTVGHGLNAEVKFIMLKSNTATDNWFCYHIGLDATSPANYDISLNTTGARRDYDTWNDTKPTNSVFSVGNTGASNENGRGYVAYCFAEVSQYSSIGSYSGNSSSDGVFVHTGFRPAWILLKRTDSSIRSWEIHDTARSPINVSENNLLPNTNGAESSGSARLDILSNGFKLRTTSNGINNGNIIYVAIAENPFQANGGLAR